MRSPYCVFRNRFIALSICLCALLAFSTTLSANTYQFVPGLGVSGLSYLGVSGIGPYGGTLTDTTTGITSPDSIFFCLTGNTTYNSTEHDNQNLGSLAPTTVGQEEAAFLYSLMLSDEVTNTVALSTTGRGNSKTLVVTGTSTNIQLFENDLGPIQMAVWYVMQTLPSAVASWGYSGTDTGILATSFTNILDYATRQDVFAAAQGYAAFANSPRYQVFITSDGGQNFIGAVPEPGTMVLFGTGVLLMALGSTRKLLARRRAR
jgi:hypothetical protein